MEQSIKLLEEWIKKQAHFVRTDFDREFLETALITRKGSVEKAKQQIEQLCTLKTIVPKLFIDGNVRDTFQYILKKGCFVAFPKLTKDYSRVVMVKPEIPSITREEFGIFFKYFTVMAEYLRYYDYPDGFIFIEDFREMNLLETFKNLPAVDFQQLLMVMIKGYGSRIRGIYFLTNSKMIEYLVKIMKHVLSEKVASRIHLMQNNEELYAHVDRDVLPVEYGGNERPIHELNDQLFDIVCSNKFETYLTKMTKMCTDESKREAGTLNEDAMGLAGSFRTLSVD